MDSTVGVLLDVHEPFVAELAGLMMTRWESQSSLPLLALRKVAIPINLRTRAYYRRFYEGDEYQAKGYTTEFATLASETLGAWIEETFSSGSLVFANPTTSDDPAYDLIRLEHSTVDNPKLSMIQIKATDSAIQSNCNKALEPV